jgi:D-aspartate ligase
VMPEKEIVETLTNKRRFYISLSGQKISFPHTYFPDNSEDVVRISREIDYPVFVKPTLSQVFQNMYNKKGFVAESREELIEDCRLAAKRNIDVLIQEIIPGPDSEVYGLNMYFDKKHDPLGLFGYRRIRGSPPCFGVGSLVESIPLSRIPEVKNVVDYLHGLGYYGLADVEFKRDPRDGKFKFLEVNPRLWLQDSFPPKCGINLNLMAYLDAIDAVPIHDKDYRVGVKWLCPSYDLPSAARMFMDRQLSFSEWIYSLRQIYDRAYSPADDFLPWILSPLSNLRGYAKRHENFKHIAEALVLEGISLFYGHFARAQP